MKGRRLLALFPCWEASRPTPGLKGGIYVGCDRDEADTFGDLQLKETSLKSLIFAALYREQQRQVAMVA